MSEYMQFASSKKPKATYRQSASKDAGPSHAEDPMKEQCMVRITCVLPCNCLPLIRGIITSLVAIYFSVVMR